MHIFKKMQQIRLFSWNIQSGIVFGDSQKGVLAPQYPETGVIDDAFIQCALLHRRNDGGDLGPVVRGNDHIVSCLQGQHSHNIVNCMDPELPASLSPAVHKILREECGFDGIAITDDLAMDAVKAYAKDGAVAVLALQAGNDMVVTTDYRTQIPAVIAAVQEGTLEESVIDDACLRVLRCKDTFLGIPENNP